MRFQKRETGLSTVYLLSYSIAVGARFLYISLNVPVIPIHIQVTSSQNISGPQTTIHPVCKSKNEPQHLIMITMAMASKITTGQKTGRHHPRRTHVNTQAHPEKQDMQDKDIDHQLYDLEPEFLQALVNQM